MAWRQAQARAGRPEEWSGEGEGTATFILVEKG